MSSDNTKPQDEPPQPNVVDKIADTVKDSADKAKEKMGNDPPEPDHLGEAKDRLFEAKDAVVGAAGHVKDAAVNAWKGDSKQNKSP